MRGATMLAGLLVLSLGCGGDPEILPPANPTPAPPPQPPRPRVTVRFEYHAPTEIDPEIARRYRSCAGLVGHTHMHASWLGFDVVPFRPEGDDLWWLSVDDVPIGYRRIRVSDANACPVHPTGAVEAHAVYANGVLLTRQVDTPGTGTEPGFSFTVDSEGVVTP